MENSVLLRVNEIQISESDLDCLNQKVNNGEEEVSLFKFYMNERGIHVHSESDWKLMTDGYYNLTFQSDSLMNLTNGIKGFLRKYLMDKRIHVYIHSYEKKQYYQMVPKKDEFLELECGYSRKQDNNYRDVKNFTELLLTHIDDSRECLKNYEDEFISPLYHKKIERKVFVIDEWVNSEDWNSEPVKYLTKMDPSDPESMRPKTTRETYYKFQDRVRKTDKTQYSFFINTFNYKESLLKDSIRILDSFWNWETILDKQGNYSRKPLFTEVK